MTKYERFSRNYSMKSEDYISIAVPIFNEVNGTVHLIEETLSLPLKKEVIIIDDGSTCETTKLILNSIKEKFPEIKMVTNEKNLGKSASIQKALKLAKGNIFVVLDGDSELNPTDILRLYKELKKENARLVNGVRVIRTKTKSFSFSQMVTKLARKIFGTFIHFFYGISIKDILSGYKLFYKEDFKNHTFSTKRFGLESDLLVATVNNKRKIIEVEVDYFPRSYKQGKTIQLFDGIEILRCIVSSIKLDRSIFYTPFGVFGIALLLWLCTFSIYTLHANSSSTSDSLPNNFTTVNILYNHRLDLTNFRPYFQIRHQKSVVTENNNAVLYAKTPIINGILAVPYFYVFDQAYGIRTVSADAFIQKDYETYYQSVGKYYAALIASISVVFVFLTLHALLKNVLYSLIGAITYGFATMVYSTASQGNWQHAPSLLLITVSFYLFFSFLTSKRQALLIAISFLLGLATLIRISNIFCFIAIISALFFYKPYRKLVIYSVIIFFLLLVTWQGVISVLGVPGGYNSEIVRSLQTFNLFYAIQVVLSLLISPNVGLFIFCPLSILSFLGIYKVLRLILKSKGKGTEPLLIFLLVSIISFSMLLLFDSFWWAWEGGYSWGPRLLIESIPFLTYLGVYFMYALQGKILKITYFVIFSILFVYGVLVQAVGVYADDNDWHNNYYKEGIDRMAMAWQIHPPVLWYYILQRKIYFTQKIVKTDDGVKIEKSYYYIDPLKGEYKKVKTVVKLL